MKKRVRADLCLLSCSVLIWFIADAVHLRAAAAEALALCAGSVIPALFPFLAVSSLLISLGFASWVSPLFSGLMTPLFGLPGSAGSALVLGLLGGYPIGAQTAADLYRNKLLTCQEAQCLLSFCNNSNPVFLISVLGVGVFGSTRIGLWLWLIHVLSALLTGLLFRNRKKPVVHRPPNAIPPLPPLTFSAAFVGAVRTAAVSMLSVCAFVIFFYVLANPLKHLDGRMAAVLVGFTELFSLTPLLTADAFSFILAAGASGWGGLSVLAQTAAALDDSGLSLRPCLQGKLVQSLLSAVLATIASPLFF